MDTRRRSFRILMLPWSGHGHICCPFLELARALTRRNFYIYFCSTQVNLSAMKQQLSEKDSITIKLVELQVPILPDLPPSYHTTHGLPPNLMPALKEAMDMAQTSFHNILRTLEPDLVLYDLIQPWAATLAMAQDIPAVLFLCPGAAFTSYHHHHSSDPNSEFPFPAIYYRHYEVARIADATVSGNKETDRFLDSIDQSSNIVIANTSREIEGKYLDYLSFLCHKKIIPIGPFVPMPETEHEQTNIIEWLNKKDRGSTVLVSFGNEYFLSREEMNEVALGLELSNVNFIWVVRSHLGEETRTVEAMPEGFLQRVGDKAMLMEVWAPRGTILGHSSIGGFLNHCGWNSIIEGIKSGIPLIAVPMHLDQSLNARLVEEVGVGEEVVRNKQGNLEKEEVARVIRKVVGERSGERFRKRTKELAESMRKKGDEDIDEVVEEMMKLCRRVERSNSVDMLR